MERDLHKALLLRLWPKQVQFPAPAETALPKAKNDSVIVSPDMER